MIYLQDATKVILHKMACEMHKRGYEIGKMTAGGAPGYSK
jgi:hypothetical protein